MPVRLAGGLLLFLLLSLALVSGPARAPRSLLGVLAGRRIVVGGGAAALAAGPVRLASAAAPPPRVEGIGGGFDMLGGRPPKDVDVLYKE